MPADKQLTASERIEALRLYLAGLSETAERNLDNFINAATPAPLKNLEATSHKSLRDLLTRARASIRFSPDEPAAESLAQSIPRKFDPSKQNTV